MHQLPNLRGNPLAVVDVETTGRVGGYHEIIQIAVVPLNLDLEVSDDVQPFYHNIKPEYPERVEKNASEIHGLNIDDLTMNAPTQEKVSEFLVEWFCDLPLGAGQRLTPIAHGWSFERGFLTPWLGPELMGTIFHPHPRDTMIFALMLNDRAAMLGKPIPFTSVSLTSMCAEMGIPYENAHNALADCVATAKLYTTVMRALL